MLGYNCRALAYPYENYQYNIYISLINQYTSKNKHYDKDRDIK